MKYGIKAYVIQDIGQRVNQEDSFYPPFLNPCHFDGTEREASYYEGTPHTTDDLFILCDGMGGHERGEVASRMVCDVVSDYIRNEEREGKQFSDAMLRSAVAEALKALDARENPATVKKMGTTMTLLKLNDNGATIAHIGDSRVYHFRPATMRRKSRMLFRTEDHNLATMLIKSGRLTFQQLHNFSQRHVLTRALQACLPKRPDVDIYHTKDIKPGDVFFLCSDGILEELYDEDLCSMLTDTSCSDEERMKVLLTFCDGNKDNHTAWFIRVEQCMDSFCNPIVKDMPDASFVGLFKRFRLWIGI